MARGVLRINRAPQARRCCRAPCSASLSIVVVKVCYSQLLHEDYTNGTTRQRRNRDKLNGSSWKVDVKAFAPEAIQLERLYKSVEKRRKCAVVVAKKQEQFIYQDRLGPSSLGQATPGHQEHEESRIRVGCKHDAAAAGAVDQPESSLLNLLSIAISAMIPAFIVRTGFGGILCY